MDKKEVLIEVKDLKKYFQVGRKPDTEGSGWGKL